MKTFKFTLIPVVMLFSIANVALCQKEEEHASLFPGESVTLFGIIVTWNVTPKDVGTKEEPEEEQPQDYGTVDIVGPKNSMQNLKLRDFNIGKPGINLYIDEVYFRITGRFQKDKLQTLSIYGLKQSQEKNVTAAPQGVQFYVSHLCPVFLNEWKFSVSEKKETFADGSEYYLLTVENPKTSERETIPLVSKASRKVGRYEISIGDVYELTRTARLYIEAGIEESIRGRDAYVESFGYDRDYPRSCTYEEFFHILGGRYGFTVEWVEYPGHPESVEYIKNEIMSQHRFSGAVQDIIDYFQRNRGLAAEWETPTHLKLWYKEYDRYLAGEKRRKEREEESKRIEEEFKNNYTAETRAYYFKTISSKTAKELIDPELDTHLLVKSSSDYYRITQGEVPERYTLVAKSMEKSAADEKTNALILTAMPKTHEKFEKIVAKIDAVLEMPEKPEALKPFMLSVTLLQGVRRASKVEGQEDVAKLAKQFGLSEQDMEFLGVQTLEKIGQGIVHLVPERGDLGTAAVSLSSNYSCILEFQDVRKPYLVVRGTLRSKDSDTALLENVIFLETGKPTLLGITNLREALVVVMRLHE